MNEPLTKAERENWVNLLSVQGTVDGWRAKDTVLLRYEATLLGLEQQLAEKDAALKEAKADAESWYEQCESARDALIRNGRDSDAALGALVKVLSGVEYVPSGVITGAQFCPWCCQRSGRGHTDFCKRQKALAPDAVQQAIEAWRAKDAEIERLITKLADEKIRSDVYDENYFEEHKKLAVAMGLLNRVGPESGLPSFWRELNAFLADSSQAIEGYRWAMQVVERVRNVERWGESLDMTRDEAMRLQAVLLGEEEL